jgi:hypothetical protein
MDIETRQNIENLDENSRFEGGIRTFSLLFTRWMDTNQWSHPVMVNLGRAALNGAAWLHSSQISGLRHGKLRSPGPRTFIAIERLNYYIHRYNTTRQLIPNTPSSNFYQDAYAITEDGLPPPLGWWTEVFCGYRIPKDIDLRVTFFTEDSATHFSKAWARYIRRLMVEANIDVIDDLESIIHRHYPAGDDKRVDKLFAVIRATATWTTDELELELPAITAMTAALGGSSSEAELLTKIG